MSYIGPNVPIVKYENFRPWVQKVMPGVYDDTLSYYELLSKVVAYLNQMNDQQNEIITWLETVVGEQNKDIEMLKKLFITFRGDMTRAFEEFTKNITDRQNQFEKDIQDKVLAVKVGEILQGWYDDGKLADIINKDVFDMKADKEYVDTEFKKVNATANSSYTFINVKDPKYGAKGDGVSDDTDAINKAIEDAQTTKSIVKIPNGTFNVQGIVLKSGVTIEGNGRTKTIIKHNGTGSAIKNTELSTPIGHGVLRDFTIMMNGATTIAIDLRLVYMFVLERINVEGGTADGWIGVNFQDGNIASAYYNSCYDVSIGTGKNNSGIGFKFTNGANSNRLMNCRTNNVKTGADIGSSDQVTIVNCAFENTSDAIVLDNTAYGCYFAGNRFENLGTQRGNGITLPLGSRNCFLFGNLYINLTNQIINSAPDGRHQIMDYAETTVNLIRHNATTGGWSSNMDMRNYQIQNAGSIGLRNSPTSQPDEVGRFGYADGTGWNPDGSGAQGLFIRDRNGFRRIKTLQTGDTSQRPQIDRFLGREYFDTTLGHPIYWNGTRWVKPDGTNA